MKSLIIKRLGTIGFFASFALSLSAQTLSVTNGLQLWLKADAGITTNDTGGVTYWADQTSNQNDAGALDNSFAPQLIPNAITNKPALRFDGTDDYLEVVPSFSLDLSTNLSSFFVVKFDDFATYRAVWAQTAGNLPAPNDYYVLPNAGLPRLYRGDGTSAGARNVDGTTAIRAGDFVVVGFQAEDTTVTHYLNGQAVGSGQLQTTPVNSGTPLKIGTRDDFVTKMKGDIAELLIFDRSLSQTERDTVVTYLQNKYGIANQPPAMQLVAPTSTTFDANSTAGFEVNATDSDGVVTKVDFFANNQRIATATAPPYRVRLLLLTGGNVALRAVATDNKGATSSTNINLTVNSGAVPAFGVTNGLQLWLKADTGITPGANGVVTTWQDQSGNGNDAVQFDETLAPVLTPNAANGQPTVRFDGVDDYLDVASTPGVSSTGDMASFFVVKFDDFATYRAVWGKTAGNVPRPTDYYLLPNSGVPRVFRGTDDGNLNAFADGAAPRAGDYVLLGFDQAGNLMTHYMNGLASGSNIFPITPTDSGTPLKIGTREDFVTKMKGDISELMIFDRSLSADEQGSLSKYLGAKYGVPIVLVSNNVSKITLVPTNNINVTTPTNLVVTTTAHDDDGSFTRVDYFLNGGLVASSTDSQSRFQLSIPILVPGTHTLTAVATDNLGGQSAPASITITATGTSSATLPITNGLSLWLRADAGVTTSTTGGVSRWADFSGNFNYALQGDPTAAPTLVPSGLNHLPTLRFDGVNDFLEVGHSPSLISTNDLTALFVVKLDDFATYRTVITKTAGNQPRSFDHYFLPNSGIPRFIRGGTVGTQSVDGDLAMNPEAFSIAGFTVSGTTMTHYFEGAFAGTGEITIPLVDSGNPLRIGRRADGATILKGELAELILYNTALSEEDYLKVNEYLRTKYFVAQPRFTGIQTQGNNVVIQWEAGSILEEAAQVTGPWTPVNNATSPYTAPNTGSQKFYRLRP